MKRAMHDETDSEYTVDILRAAQQGDRKSIEKTLEQFTPSVHKMVNRYGFLANSYMKEDLIQEGMLGICKGIETFDFSKGVRPSTWIVWKVRGAVLGAARKEKNHPKYTESIDSLDMELPAETYDDYVEEGESSKIKNLLLKRFGDEKSMGYRIVCHKFGLYGHSELSQTEIKDKLGQSKQVVSGCISRLKKSLRTKHPELVNLISQ